MKYRKKPVEIEAIQYTGDNFNEIKDFINTGERPMKMTELGTPVIETNEGDMYVSTNDWVIKEPFPINDRKFYPCKPDIFEQTYEPL